MQLGALGRCALPSRYGNQIIPGSAAEEVMVACTYPDTYARLLACVMPVMYTGVSRVECRRADEVFHCTARYKGRVLQMVVLRGGVVAEARPVLGSR